MHDESPETPERFVPPPVLYGAALVLGQIAQFCRRLPIMPRIFTPLRRLLGGVLVVGGLAWGFWGLRTMQRAGASPDQADPPPSLVVDGPFQYSRNPLYVMMTAVYLGIILLRNNLWGMLLLPGLLALVQRKAIKREEDYLQARFGDAYHDYKERVPRWL